MLICHLKATHKLRRQRTNKKKFMTANLPKLQKFLAASGLCSRRKAEEWIADGKVTVNGKIAQIGMRINPESDMVKANGKRIQTDVLGSLTLMVNKPKGFTCSNQDEHADRLIFELLEKKHARHRLFCAGRLDVESEGLVILTNDGDLSHRLTHPSRETQKRYQVELNRKLQKEDFHKLLDGIEVEGEHLRLDQIKTKSGTSPVGATKMEIRMGHGKKREIRRAFGSFKYQVRKLRRIAVGKLFLNGLPLGNYRELEKKEIDLLFSG